MSTRGNTWKSWPRRVLAIAVTALSLVASLGLSAGAAAAQANGGGNGPNKTTTTTAPTGSTTTTVASSKGGGGVANPKLTAATALSRHRVLVTYDRDLDAAALDVASYAFYSTQAVNLPILGVSRATNNQAFVTTEAQEPVTYTVKLPKTPRPVTFTGSTVAEPKLESARPVSSTQIIVTFSEPVGTSALQPSAYQITVQGSTTTLAVTRATAFGSNGTQVLLTTAPQQAVPYVLNVVGDIQGTSGAYLDPTALTIALSGSTVPAGPMLLSAVPQGETSLLLTFDTPLAASATETSRYTANPSLTVKSAVLLSGNTQVQLTTSPMYAVPYTIVANVVDAQGRTVNQNYNTVSFKGSATVSNERPKVVTAASTGNTSVVVQFSQAMSDNAADASRYVIVQQNVNPEVGYVPVTAAAFVDAERLSVKLTTRSQNEVTYQVTVNNVTDVAGKPLAEKITSEGVSVDPTSFTFAGTAPSGAELVNSDCMPNQTPPDYCDTLYDHQEYSGWTVTVQHANMTTTSRQVTSNPDVDDTDGDGLTDDVEKALNSDPRDNDTDDDGLSDWAEFNEFFSDPTDQDSDGDTLYDGVEATFFFTSPLLEDTDGDQLKDAYEINVNRNPKVADLPLPVISVGETAVSLKVDFSETLGTNSRHLDSKTKEATLMQSSTNEYSTSEASTHELSTTVGYKAGAEVGWSGFFSGPTFQLSFEASTESTNTNSHTSEFTRSSSEATEKAYSDSLTTEKEISADASLTRAVTAATVRASVFLESKGNVAFTAKNLQLAVLIPDAQDPSRLKPFATLVPETGLETSFNLGPLVPPKGPIVFANNDVFPNVVEDLMANPRGLVFRFGNYDVVDEGGRNFAFTSQEVTERTARIAIDYGGFDQDGDGQGEDTEIFRVATAIMGRVVDTNGDGKVDGSDHKVIFDPEGKQVGITLRDALAAAGLKWYDETTTPTSSLRDAERYNSYSTKAWPDGKGERIFRVRDRKVEEGAPKQWDVITPTGINRNLTLDERILYPGSSVTLSYVEDLDQDRLPGLTESVFSCDDTKVDTDGDGLDDRFEVLIGWKVTTAPGGSRNVRSRCASPDSDGDGLGDRAEAPGTLTYQTGTTLVLSANRSVADDGVDAAVADPVTDPLSRDTDGDGLTDNFELTAYSNEKLPKTDPPTYTELRTTSPEHADTDGDGASDGVERRLGGDPRVNDYADIWDTDRDGLTDNQEKSGWQIVVTPVLARTTNIADVCKLGLCSEPKAASPVTVTSDPAKADTDGDGLSDYEEAKLKTNPTSKDTDGDGLTDYEEVKGFKLRDLTTPIMTDPTKMDTDNDKRSDGEEADRVGPIMVIRMPGKAPYQVFSHPLNADADFDYLVDGDEQTAGTHPAVYNTDEDNQTDYNEVLAGRRPLVPDYQVTLTFQSIYVIQDGDKADSDPGEVSWSLDATSTNMPPRDPSNLKYGPIDANAGQTLGLDQCWERFFGWFKFPPEDIPCRTTFDIGPVSTTDALYEEFAVKGYINQGADESVTECVIPFPGDGLADGDRPGTMSGKELKPGIQSWSLHRKTKCVNGNDFEVTLFLTLKAT